MVPSAGPSVEHAVVSPARHGRQGQAGQGILTFLERDARAAEFQAVLQLRTSRPTASEEDPIRLLTEFRVTCR